jgi:hypothetical protein
MASLIEHRWSSATDTRPYFLSLGTPIIGCLHGCHMERVRIGITEFANMAQCSDRLISHKTFMKIRTAFPHADVTFLMNVARFETSEEEIAFLPHAADLVAHAVEVMIQEAHPGVRPQAPWFCCRLQEPEE